MAHKEQQDFCLKVKNTYPEFFSNKKVLDIGSLDVNGTNRYLFNNCEYIGLDVGEGSNVDVVCPGHLYDAPDGFFDVIISTEVFEHDMFYEQTIMNIMRMLKDGGLFFFTCASVGRPEHGTIRCGSECAPLLMSISEEWGNYYKNLIPSDFEKIPKFKETFPDGKFELKNTNIQIPSDLYFVGIKGGIKYYTKNEKKNNEKYNDDIFVIDSWPDNESKESDLIKLIHKLKTFNIPILLVGHYPIKPEIQKMVDYYLFDKNNPILLEKDFDAYDVGSGFWSSADNWYSEVKYEYHHDYAIWETMRNAFNFVKYLGYSRIHFLEYDNLIDVVQYRQAFLEESIYFDAVLYEYSKGSISDKDLSEYCATFIFSIKTDVAVQLIDQIKSKKEYFINKPKGWQLERVFLSELKKITNNIFASKYIPNDNELNTQAVWNRDGMLRNGAIFRIFVVVDKYQNLYCQFMSGFHDIPANNDYLVEINYDNFKGFHNIEKGKYSIVNVGKYKKGKKIKVYYEGVEVLNEFLYMDFKNFYRLNTLKFNDDVNQNKKVNVNFTDGAFFELIEDDINSYHVEFINKKTDTVEYSLKLNSNYWAKTFKKYFVDWRIRFSTLNQVYTYDLELKNKNVLISFESKSIGDTIAWIPYVDEFRKKHDCQVFCSTFHNYLFSEKYKNIQFIKPGAVVHNVHALYRIGLMMNQEKYDEEYHPSDPKKLPLQQIASDILGLDFVEISPNLEMKNINKKNKVSIAIHSTAQSKYWNNANGWQTVVDYLKSKNYDVVLLSNEPDGFMGNKTPKGVITKKTKTLLDAAKEIVESEFFVGLSSGLSWLSWAYNVPTVLISGFTDDDLEPKKGVYRVINKNVCNGCWSRHVFDPGDWNWCPDHKGTDRQFECTKSITPEMVIEKIDQILTQKNLLN